MIRTAILLLGLLGACSLEPKYVRPGAAVPTSWRAGDPALRASETALPSLGYRDLFRDQRLQRLIERALTTSQDVRAAAANIEAARGLYRAQRAELLPAIDATAGASIRDTGGGTTAGGNARRRVTSYSANVGASAFEIDLFGRIRSLSNAALGEYFATEAAARTVRLTLVADIADAWTTIAADRSLLVIARDTETSAAQSERLTQARLAGGVAPRTDLRQAQTILATAQSDVANLTTLVAQDRNALDLLVGAPVAESDLPGSIESVAPSVIRPPAGLDSAILLRRPDIVQAEYQLRAANARIGAARAAFFPRLSLTGVAGFASLGLSSLFSGGSFSYSVAPSAIVPIFDGGANRGNLVYARAQAVAATANYQRSIQAAFRDVSDALARTATIADQLAAQGRLERAAADSAYLTEERYRGGVASFLESLDAQRTLYTARRSLASARLADAAASIALYRALGGDQLYE